jgi:4a-hydroxytetrahydrobiopterin dehydratase
MPQTNSKMSPKVAELSTQMCREMPQGSEAMSPGEISLLIGDFPGWDNLANCEIAKTYKFENFYETMAFVNAMALVVHRQNHHPELELSFNRARVRFSTHSVGGLSENDFICAAKIEAMMEQV